MNGIGIGIGRKRKSYWSNPLQDKYKSLLAAVSQKPSKSVQNAQNTFMYRISGGNSDSRNTLAKLSCIIPYCAGMPLAVDALLWWNNPVRKATLSVHAPDYTLLEGFTGDSANSAYINTGFNPTDDGGTLYTQNNCSVGWWFRNTRTTYSSTKIHGIAVSTNKIYINPWHSATKARIGANGEYYDLTTVNGGSMLFTINRKNATTINAFIDRLLTDNISNNSVGLLDGDIYNLALNNGTTAANFTSDTIGLFYAGSELDQTDVNVICDALDQLMFDLNTSVAVLNYPADGTLIDTNIWTITNPNTTSVEFEQNNAIIMRSLGVSSTADANNIKATFDVPYGVFIGSLVDIYKATVYRSLNYRFGNLNRFVIQRYGNLNQNLMFRLYNGASYIYDLDIGEYEFVIFKIVYTATHRLSFYKWSNDAWLLIDSYITTNICGNVKSIDMSSTGYLATETHLRDIYITKKDFNTLTP